MLNRLTRSDAGITTYTGVVRPWECDRNDHWNVQFYLRGFQMASEILATAATGHNPGAASAAFRHFRFHGELRATETMKVVSGRIAEGAMAGLVLHRMVTGPQDRLSATAVEAPAYPAGDLPEIGGALLEKALPRGLSGRPHVPETAGPGVAVGAVRPSDVDHAGLLQWNMMANFCSAASHAFLARTGLTAAWVNETNCNRMAVEMALTVHAPCRAGTLIDVSSRVSDAGERHFATRHDLADAASGAALASIEQLMLVIDLGTRRPVAIPDFLRAAAGSGA